MPSSHHPLSRGFIRCCGDLLRCCVVVSSVVAEPASGSEAEPAFGSEAEPALGLECTTAHPLAFAKKKNNRRLHQHRPGSPGRAISLLKFIKEIMQIMIHICFQNIVPGSRQINVCVLRAVLTDTVFH